MEDFGVYRRDLGRSLSSRTLLDSSISSEFALLAKYERLSQSMRSHDEPPPRQRECGIWRHLAHVLLARKATNRASGRSRELLGIVKQEPSTATSKEAKATKRKQKKIKRRSSWLPDPERRWPIQGW